MFGIKAREPNEVSSLTHLKVSFGTLLNELKNLL